MITKIKVTKLFGLYDYDLDISNSVGDRIRFITGPNGYGKTTLLRFINGAINGYAAVFFEIPYERIEMTSDDMTLIVNQIRPSKPSDADVDEDDIEVEFGLASMESFQKIRFADLQDGIAGAENVYRMMSLFSTTTKCRFFQENGNLNILSLFETTRLIKEKMLCPNADFKNKIDVLEDIIDSLGFSGKILQVSPSFGYRFVSENNNMDEIGFGKMSSGERRMLDMVLYMLFSAPNSSLVLVDAPEASLHLAWQGSYLAVIRKILSVRNIQCIMATHSPMIFDSEYDLTVDLFDQTHKNA